MHIEELNPLQRDQSAYREFHSNEAALYGIVSDLLECLYDGKCAVLIILDFKCSL